MPSLSTLVWSKLSKFSDSCQIFDLRFKFDKFSICYFFFYPIFRSKFHFRFQVRFNPIKSAKFSVIFKFDDRCCPLNVCQSDIFFPKSLRVTVQAQKLTRPDSLSSFRFRCPMLEKGQSVKDFIKLRLTHVPPDSQR